MMNVERVVLAVVILVIAEYIMEVLYVWFRLGDISYTVACTVYQSSLMDVYISLQNVMIMKSYVTRSFPFDI